MSDPLAVYLSDHVAGSLAAIDLLEFLRDEHEGEPLGRFSAEMLVEIEADRDVLNNLVEQFGAQHAATLKEAVAWLSEKATHLKLRRQENDGLGSVLALESLALGIHGKRALWRTLAAVAAHDSRLTSINYDRLIKRAEAQHEEVEEQRLRMARIVLIDAEE